MPRYHLVSKLKYSDKGFVIECLEEKGIERKGKDDIYSPLSILCTMVLFVCLISSKVLYLGAAYYQSGKRRPPEARN